MNTTRDFFNTKPYVVSKDSKGYYYIDNTCTYADLMGMIAEETTSPRGVESKLQVGGCDGDYFLFYWQPEGKKMILDHFCTKEDAELEWLNRTYLFDFIDSELYYVTHDDKLDAIEQIAMALEISIETTKSLLRWHEKLQIINAERARKSMVHFLEKSIKDSQGKPTKKLRQAVNYFRFNVPMWGNDYNLMLKVPYSDEELEQYDKAKDIVLKVILK